MSKELVEKVNSLVSVTIDGISKAVVSKEKTLQQLDKDLAKARRRGETINAIMIARQIKAVSDTEPVEIATEQVSALSDLREAVVDYYDV